MLLDLFTLSLSTTIEAIFTQNKSNHWIPVDVVADVVTPPGSESQDRSFTQHIKPLALWNTRSPAKRSFWWEGGETFHCCRREKQAEIRQALIKRTLPLKDLFHWRSWSASCWKMEKRPSLILKPWTGAVEGDQIYTQNHQDDIEEAHFGRFPSCWQDFSGTRTPGRCLPVGGATWLLPDTQAAALARNEAAFGRSSKIRG